MIIGWTREVGSTILVSSKQYPPELTFRSQLSILWHFIM